MLLILLLLFSHDGKRRRRHFHNDDIPNNLPVQQNILPISNNQKEIGNKPSLNQQQQHTQNNIPNPNIINDVTQQNQNHNIKSKIENMKKINPGMNQQHPAFQYINQQQFPNNQYPSKPRMPLRYYPNQNPNMQYHPLMNNYQYQMPQNPRLYPYQMPMMNNFMPFQQHFNPYLNQPMFFNPYSQINPYMTQPRKPRNKVKTIKNSFPLQDLDKLNHPIVGDPDTFDELIYDSLTPNNNYQQIQGDDQQLDDMFDDGSDDVSLDDFNELEEFIISSLTKKSRKKQRKNRQKRIH
ncbi:hypothetical protein TRFO_15871 [Tritrichomonas foetus]|uniref:Uncharacterized protein n=1 Tax=Tritrichomonas foetus TaxID=1144522 RepID=A0A1J4KRE3_9EUKA|nr:hypothetical protein TRFO_15871 [Tritrichomonas foetus]|eukprot:OHT13857.1 hypothetical protein TRFO_15871 [Tritrichomonas foetus]